MDKIVATNYYIVVKDLRRIETNKISKYSKEFLFKKGSNKIDNK